MAQNYDTFIKFQELVTTDEKFREKLQTAIENYKGEQTEEAIFEQVLVPLAKEAGFSATYKEFQEFKESFANKEASEEELGQIAGGKDGNGAGATACLGIGAGAGLVGGENGNAQICMAVGIGFGAGICFVKGVATDSH